MPESKYENFRVRRVKKDKFLPNIEYVSYWILDWKQSQQMPRVSHMCIDNSIDHLLNHHYVLYQETNWKNPLQPLILIQTYSNDFDLKLDHYAFFWSRTEINLNSTCITGAYDRWRVIMQWKEIVYEKWEKNDFIFPSRDKGNVGQKDAKEIWQVNYQIVLLAVVLLLLLLVNFFSFFSV